MDEIQVDVQTKQVCFIVEATSIMEPTVQYIQKNKYIIDIINDLYEPNDEL